jgi:hypothetical protein
MKENSNTRMKMSIVKALDTKKGSTNMIAAKAPSHSQRGLGRSGFTASTLRTDRSDGTPASRAA